MIRTINKQDKRTIYEILKKEFGVDYKEDSPFTRWYIYELENKIIGFINLDLIYEKAEIEYIYVDSRYRRQKIATKLLESIEKELKKLNVENITLEVNVNNKTAISFYEKNNFKKVSIREKYYGKEDAYLMLKSWW